MRPPLPDIQLEVVEDLSPAQAPGFLRLRRRRLRARYADGGLSNPFVYDEVDRAAIDAAVIVAHFREPGGAPWVYLRSALRPPLVFRDRARSPVPELDPPGSIWELPAGLIETHEQTPEGVRRSALRELREELGFSVSEEQLVALGPSVFPCPGIIAERHFYFEVEVEPKSRREPELDGSPLEHDGVVFALELEQALALCNDGTIVDSKTELGLRRLKDRLS